MRVLLTGATGLLGKSLGPRLVREGYEVVALVRRPSMARAELTFPCRIYGWDSERESPPPEALDGIQSIIHLAGENIARSRWTSRRKIQLRESRIGLTRRLAEALTRQQITLESFITASAVGYYGDRGDEVLTEASSPGGGFLAELCRDWEREAESVPAGRIAKLRFGVVLSPLGGFLHQVLPLFRRFGASRLGPGGQYFSWVHIDDLVGAIILALKNPGLEGPVNVVAPQPLTNADMTEIIAQVLKVSRAPPVPAIVLKLIYGELASALLGSQRAVPQVLKKFDFHFSYPDLKQAMNAIYSDMTVGGY
jgi:uncharacterized protein (TIGR01777 family)